MISNTAKKEEIKELVLLNNRYGESNYLRKIEKNKYKYEGETDYLRIGYKDDSKNEYQFIDPSGGPFLSIGSEVFGIKGKLKDISLINDDFILTFE